MIRNLLKRLSREDGFTLTELIVVLPVLTLVLGAITITIVTLMNGNSTITEQLTQQETTRPTLDSMMADIRSSMPLAIGGSSIVSATSTQLVLYSPDHLTAASGPTVAFHLRELAYQFSGGALQRQSVASTNTFNTITSTTPWGTWTSASGNFPLATFPTTTGWTTLLGTGLAGDGSSRALSSAAFSYYDGNGNAISAPVSAANIGLIRTIAVNVTATTGGQQGKLTTYSNTATIRETQPTQ